MQCVNMECEVPRILNLQKVFFFYDNISCRPGWSQTHYIVKDDLELLVLLPLPLSHVGTQACIIIHVLCDP